MKYICEINVPPPASQAQFKRESYAMALKLMTQYRISIEMAAWSLKHSGHSREEIDCFIEELIKGINNAP